ncbi:hypothetical protein [Paenibacillus artemisiicola]|uniref:hypothetical protein n=1 Tax=Paenibacillus artemisiicola TaxID=1172618 RepID=UPI001F0AD5AB|nr:hypothetical protein [Paenibacillus artemisiicola]
MQFTNASWSQSLHQCEQIIQQLVNQTHQASQNYQMLLQQEQQNAQQLEQLAQREQRAAQIIQTALQGHQTAIQQLQHVAELCRQAEQLAMTQLGSQSLQQPVQSFGMNPYPQQMHGYQSMH